MLGSHSWPDFSYITHEMKLPVVCKPLRTERELEMASKRDLARAAASGSGGV